MERFHVGHVTVTRVLDCTIDGRGVIPKATRSALRDIQWLRPHFSGTEDSSLPLSIHALVVEAEGHKIVVDTCVGNDKPRAVSVFNRLKGPFLSHLNALGYTQDAIDTVICTHMHVDHVGWNTTLVDGKWVPTFPNAKYIFVEDEYRHWVKESESSDAAIMQDSVQPIVDAGLALLVPPSHCVLDTPNTKIWLESSAGHTPGHVCVRISSAGQDAVITGDMMHHPCQFAHPEWTSPFDNDPNKAVATRRRLCEEWATRPMLVFGTHFAPPSAGRVHRDGDAYRLEPATHYAVAAL